MPWVGPAMLALGASTLAPWLAYIAAADFFLDTYPEANLMFVFPVQNFTFLVAGSFLLMWYGETMPLNQRIVIPQLVLVLAMAVVPALNILGTPKETALLATLVAQGAGAICVTVYQAASYGAGAFLGPDVTNKLEAGKGIGGVGIILARIISKWVLPETKAGLRASTNAFFAFSNGLVIAAVSLWFILLRTPFAREKFAQYEEQRRGKLSGAENRGGSGEAGNGGRGSSGGGRGGGGGSKAGGVELGWAAPPREKMRLIEAEQNADDYQSSSSSRRSENGLAATASTPLLVVFRTIAKPAAVVCSTFVVCLACFPGLTTALRSRTLDLGDWFPVLLVCAYNTADLVGKSLPAYRMLFDQHSLVFPALAHLLFVPLFALVASTGVAVDSASSTATASLLASVLASDEFAIFLVFALGISTGYITCSAMMLGCSSPDLAKSDHVSAGNIMVNCLMTGLCAGSFVGMALSALAR
jgi:equilibrative nucleoside transporter 1/2/3